MIFTGKVVEMKPSANIAYLVFAVALFFAFAWPEFAGAVGVPYDQKAEEGMDPDGIGFNNDPSREPPKDTLAARNRAAMKKFAAQDYSKLTGFGGLKGFSDEMLNNHFKIYQENVKNTNTLFFLLKRKIHEPENVELNRSLNHEFACMRLHELYFSNLGGNGRLDNKSSLYKDICAEFGSFERWKENFTLMGMMRGEGWMILYRDRQTGSLFNMCASDIGGGLLADCTPVLVMDVYEHAYSPDFHLDREKYIAAFMDNVNWEEAGKRYSEK